jgi:riboflavin biosynthesis pyrimidine reductase
MRPRVIAHNLTSLDGRLTVAPGVLLLSGDERWKRIAGDVDAYARLMRDDQPDAILEGSGSFVTDDAPSAFSDATTVEVPPGDFLPEEVIHRPGHRGWFVIVDGRGRVQWQFKESPDPAMPGWHLLVLVHDSTPAGYLDFLQQERIPYLVAGSDRVDLTAALERLGDRLDVRCVLATGGGRLQGALLRAGLVDDLDLELLPALIGGAGTPSLFGGQPLRADEQPTLVTITECSLVDGRILVRASIRPR